MAAATASSIIYCLMGISVDFSMLLAELNCGNVHKVGGLHLQLVFLVYLRQAWCCRGSHFHLSAKRFRVKFCPVSSWSSPVCGFILLSVPLVGLKVLLMTGALTPNLLNANADC